MPASSEQDRVLIQKLQGWVEDATLNVRDLHTKWDLYGDFYQGVQTSGVDLSDDASQDWVPINLVYSTIRTVVPAIKGSAPLWYVKALEDGLPEGVEEQLTSALQAIWYMRRIARQYGMAVVDQELRGTGFLKAWWNPDIGPETSEIDGRGRIQRQRAGDVDVSWLDPYSVYPDPAARSLEDCEWLALANDMAPERAKRLWDGSNGGKAFDENAGQLVTDDTQRPQSWLSRAIAWVVGSNVTNVPGQRRTYRIWEVYHEAGHRLTIYSGQQMLWDGDNPTPGEQFPVVCFPKNERGESFWGMPDTSQLIGIQTKINKLHLLLHQYLRLLGDAPIVTNDPQLKQELDQKGGRLGSIMLERGDNGRTRYLELPNLPAWVFAHFRELYEDMKTVSGVQDVMRGLRPGSVQSGIGIQSLQEGAMTRPRDTASDNALQLERLGQIVLDMMQEKYDGDRTFAYHDGSKFVRQTVTPDMLKQERLSPEADGSELLGPEGGDMGGMMGGMGPESVQVPHLLRVVVEPGGNLPLNAMAQAEVAFKAAQTQFPDGPGIDRQAFLEALKFPHRQEIMQRMQSARAAQLQGQMAAQQQQQAQQQQAQQMQMAQQQAMMGDQGGPAGGVPPEAGLPPLGTSGMPPGGPPGGAPDDFEGAAPQDFGTAVQSLLQPILEALSPEDQQLLMAIIQELANGQPLTPEQVTWLESLPPDVQDQIEQLLSALGIGGRDVGMAPALAGPTGMVP